MTERRTQGAAQVPAATGEEPEAAAEAGRNQRVGNNVLAAAIEGWPKSQEFPSAKTVALIKVGDTVVNEELIREGMVRKSRPMIWER
jgi:hypothetical protein